jgi:pimeloyl-ACP methyl ester carboxylesterase
MRPNRTGVAAAVVAVMLAVACGGERSPVVPPTGARTLSIPGPAGTTLDAVEMGEGDRVVVLTHGSTGTKEGFYPLLPALADAGYRAIAYDARGVGSSTGENDPTTRGDDLEAVVDHARSSGATSISLGGASLGANITLAQAGALEADAVVLLSPALARVPDALAEDLADIPVFIAVAMDNEPFATQARELGETLGVEPTVVTGDHHGTGMFGDHPELLVAVVDFLATTR